ncbi:GNAT family N-acetyltransferase [uncultured Roseivirga sp.]|uniref:GNAT family N-acetyltransferase n=1 Tax=uncultured Roseivirga sp. TaxID=543088 RepID=UPI0030DB14A1|tara:strand:- start:5907 stop:6347 length:441 start_codon:yes stop_codon:yes gene_type:complete
MVIDIQKGTLLEALKVLGSVPEFDPLLESDYYEGKVKNKVHIILLAKVDDKVVGCKIGYNKHKDGSLYSWLGGVLPEYRRHGVAKALADEMETWALNNGYAKIRFKTLNRHKAMLAFSLKNGFDIFNVKPKDELENYRIELVKHLK